MKIFKTIKYKGQFHKAYSDIEIDKEDLPEFIRKGIIKSENEKSEEKQAIKQPTTSVKEQHNTIGIEVEETPTMGDNGLELDYTDYTRAELKIMLENKNIAYNDRANKDELINLLVGA